LQYFIKKEWLIGYELSVWRNGMEIKSLENKNNCLPYLEECRRLTKLIKRYQPGCKHLFENQAASVVREEYSLGGYALHRGYYCPSLIDDIIIGGCNRVNC